ncbi:DUF6624 domain-containing protein [Streptomyces sp. NPDC004732]|uniref:DUF6624 domain-containing protein n=1 Tax=Streptomyces sp. NPDC004732 TaxID=3154290 RepID=UPI0033B5F0FA
MTLSTRDQAEHGVACGQVRAAEAHVADPATVLVHSLASRLIRMSAEDEALTREAIAMPGAAHRRHAVLEARAAHGQALKVIVGEAGWPTFDDVGEEASTAALKVLLHADDLNLQLSCRELIRAAVLAGTVPAIQGAYVEDHCAVSQGDRQTFGTKINEKLLRPYPIDDPEHVTERRRAVGLPPLGEEITRHLLALRSPQ